MERITVVKIGGNVIDSPEATARFVEAFAALEGPKLLVHGGGKLATRLAAQLGIESRMVDGRRITDRETLDVVTMVYAGLINKSGSSRPCRPLAAARSGCRAPTAMPSPRCGVRPEPSTTAMWATSPRGRERRIAAHAARCGLTPVFSAITCDGRGTLLNTNADSVASAVAVAASRIAPTQLVFCFEKAGGAARRGGRTERHRRNHARHPPRCVPKGRSARGCCPRSTGRCAPSPAAWRAWSSSRPRRCSTRAARRSGVDETIAQTVMERLNELQAEAVALLEKLVATPSVSRDEARTADLLRGPPRGARHRRRAAVQQRLCARRISTPRSPRCCSTRTTTRCVPRRRGRATLSRRRGRGERLYGLGANDAGASVAALTAAFRHYYDAELPFNLLLALSGEEECMGEHGTRALLPALGPIDMALVGEPTRMRAAVGERGLVVLDCTAHGRAGHAARDEGINALSIAADDIAWLRGYRFERCSPLLGPIRMTATQIEAGTQHNVVPAECRFVVDVRTTDAYTNEETVEIVRRHMRSEAVPRSTRIRASAVAPEHPLVGGGRGARRRTLRLAHHVGHGAHGVPVAQNGRGRFGALAYGRRIRAPQRSGAGGWKVTYVTLPNWRKRY